MIEFKNVKYFYGKQYLTNCIILTIEEEMNPYHYDNGFIGGKAAFYARWKHRQY